MVASKKATIQNNFLRLWRHTPSPRFEMNEGVCVGMIHLALCNGSCDGPSPSSAPRASALPPPTIMDQRRDCRINVTTVLLLVLLVLVVMSDRLLSELWKHTSLSFVSFLHFRSGKGTEVGSLHESKRSRFGSIPHPTSTPPRFANAWRERSSGGASKIRNRRVPGPTRFSAKTPVFHSVQHSALLC